MYVCSKSILNLWPRDGTLTKSPCISKRNYTIFTGICQFARLFPGRMAANTIRSVPLTDAQRAFDRRKRPIAWDELLLSG